MREDAVDLEESRLHGIDDIREYQEDVKLGFKERHRVFPAIFENRQHKRILDIAAGVGCAAQRIRDNYPAELVCSDISPTCLRILNKLQIPTISFDIDDNETSFPFADDHFDAVISLVTIEHLIHVDHFVREIHRILCNDGYLYIATPNYAAPEYWVRTLLLSGRTFHNPLGPESTRYEFYGHVRYFTYRTLLEFVSSFGFVPEAVYLALPSGSTRYLAMYSASRIKALTARYAMWLKHRLLSPRWATEPILCFQKKQTRTGRKLRKVVL
jgi:SAM-dependent methyltransferase